MTQLDLPLKSYLGYHAESNHNGHVQRKRAAAVYRTDHRLARVLCNAAWGELPVMAPMDEEGEEE